MQVSPIGRGVAYISSMLNITRLHNTTAAVASMRRHARPLAVYITLYTQDHLTITRLRPPSQRVRPAPDRLAIAQPHTGTHARALHRYGCGHALGDECGTAGQLMLLDAVTMLGRVETAAPGHETDAVLLRLLTPVIKLYTAKTVCVHASALAHCSGNGRAE